MEDEGINKNPEWVTRGKTIRQLIEELHTFEDQDLEVKISIDEGETLKCISLIGNIYREDEDTKYCCLMNCEENNT